jgi:hypothetical protein
MSLDDPSDIAGTESVLSDVAGQDHALYMSKGMAYLGYMVMNRGASVPVSTCQTAQKRTLLPLGVLLGPSIS